MDNDDGDGDGDDNEDEPRSGNTTQLYIDTVFEEVTAVAVALAVAVAVAVAVMYQQSSSSYMYVRTVYIYSQYHACALPDESNRIESNRTESNRKTKNRIERILSVWLRLFASTSTSHLTTNIRPNSIRPDRTRHNLRF